jgi:hypothetical protein
MTRVTNILMGMESKFGEFTHISDYNMQVYSSLSQAE